MDRWGAAVTFVVRVLLGAIFAMAGVLKIGHFNELAAAIAGFRILPPVAVGPLAVMLPFFELGLGLYLMTGFFTRGAALVACAQLFLYAAAIASALIRHIPANCGCFCPTDAATADWPHVGVDVALALVCAVIAWRAPGLFSIDERMRKA